MICRACKMYSLFLYGNLGPLIKGVTNGIVCTDILYHTRKIEKHFLIKIFFPLRAASTAAKNSNEKIDDRFRNKILFFF